MRETEKKLLVDHINTLKKKKAEKIREKTRLIGLLESTLTGEDLSTVLRVTDKSASTTFFNVKRENMKKFDKLYHETQRKSAGEKTPVAKTPVNNISGKPLSDIDVQVLEKGLGFAPAPKVLPVKEMHG